MTTISGYMFTVCLAFIIILTFNKVVGHFLLPKEYIRKAMLFTGILLVLTIIVSLCERM